MIIDVMSLFFPDALKGNGLTGSHPSWVYQGRPDENGVFDLVCIKGNNVNPSILGGYPWDWMRVGDKYFKQKLTELVWNLPNTGKMKFNDGDPRFFRYIDYSPNQPFGTWGFSIGRPLTDYVIFDIDPKGGKYGIPTKRNTDSIVSNAILGPFPAPATGDLPAGYDWYFEYIRNNGTVKERKTTRTLNPTDTSYGPYRWTQFKLVNGIFVQDTDVNGKPYDSINNKLLNIPCPNPVQLIW